MKRTSFDAEWEKKPKRVEKGLNKVGKHKKSIYNMLSEFEEDMDLDSDIGEVKHGYSSNVNYTKQR